MVCSLLLLLCAVLLSAPCSAQQPQRRSLDLLVPGFRPPSIPIIVLTPTISMWVNHDRLTDDFVQHWSGPTMALVGLVRVDGAAYRFLGPDPSNVTAMAQSALYVTPTQTLAVFSGAGVQLNLTFSQAAFPDDLSYYSRPYAYITVDVASTDGQSHAVQVYVPQSHAHAHHRLPHHSCCSLLFHSPSSSLSLHLSVCATRSYMDHAADVVVNRPDQLVDWMDASGQLRETAAAGARALRMGMYVELGRHAHRTGS